MNAVTQLGFISTRISELETAVFHSHSNSILNLGATLIKTIKTDEDGRVWFTVNKPSQSITEFEKQFPVALNYYKKGVPFFLNVFGAAKIINDQEELPSEDLAQEMKEAVKENKILLCVKIAHVNYYEKEVAMNESWMSKWKRLLTDMFMPGDSYYSPSFDQDGHFA